MYELLKPKKVLVALRCLQYWINTTNSGGYIRCLDSSNVARKSIDFVQQPSKLDFVQPIYCPPGQDIPGLKYCKPNLTLYELKSIFGPDYPLNVEDTNTGETHYVTIQDLIQEWLIDNKNRSRSLFCKIGILNSPIQHCYEPPAIIDRLAGGLCSDIQEERLFYCVQKHVRYELKSDFNCTWLFVLSGKFKLTMYAPTEFNKMMHLLSSTGEFYKKDIFETKEPSFKAESDTELEIILEATAFIAIPTGWMYTFEALDDGYIFGGQFLDRNNIDWQFTWLARKLAIDDINGKEEDIDHIRLLLQRLAARQINAGRDKLFNESKKR